MSVLYLCGMKQMYKTKQDCLDKALLCSSRMEFTRKFSGAAAKAQKEGWYKEICQHLIPLKRNRTKEEIIEVAKNFLLKSDFYKKEKASYVKALRENWLDEVCQHMKTGNPRYVYNKEKCKELALSCKTKKEFSEKYDSAYQQCYKKGWVDEVCSHMIVLNDKKFRDIYVIKSKDKLLAYVGLSYNAEERYKQHKVKTTEKVQEILTSEHELVILEKHIPTDEAIKREILWIDYYKNLGYNLANSAKGGSIGAPFVTKWTKENIMIAASKAKSRTEFCRTNSGAYDAAQFNGWLEEIFPHLPPAKNKKVKIMIRGELLTFKEISKRFSIPWSSLTKRYYKGLTGEDLIRNKKQQTF